MPIAMGFLDLMNHLFNFLLPAVLLGLLLAWITPLFGSRSPSQWSVARQSLTNVLVGCVVLCLGLLFFGRDGKMVSYAAMVLACASCQCLGAMRRG
jgi:hypothetical protein